MERRTVIVPGVVAGGNIGAGANDPDTPPPMQPRAPPNSAEAAVSNEGQDMAAAARERQARFAANMAREAAAADQRALLDAVRIRLAALPQPERDRLDNRIHRH